MSLRLATWNLSMWTTSALEWVEEHKVPYIVCSRNIVMHLVNKCEHGVYWLVIAEGSSSHVQVHSCMPFSHVTSHHPHIFPILTLLKCSVKPGTLSFFHSVYVLSKLFLSLGLISSDVEWCMISSLYNIQFELFCEVSTSETLGASWWRLEVM